MYRSVALGDPDSYFLLRGSQTIPGPIFGDRSQPHVSIRINSR